MNSRQQLLSISASHAPGMTSDTTRQVGIAFREGLDRARVLAEGFDPDLVVMFGSDHRRAYEPVIPAISVVVSAEGYGDHGSPTGPYAVPSDVARSLATHLLAAGFDVAVSRGVRLDHGFGETLAYLTGSLDARPVLPVFINCATPPLATPNRAVELGRAVGGFVGTLPAERVLVIGSGGLSHSPPTLEVETLGLSDDERRQISRAGRAAAAAKINPEWDHEFLGRLAVADTAWLSSVSQEFLSAGGVGANEIRTWLATWAAGGEGPMETLAYEPVEEWITGMGVVASADFPRKASSA